MVGEEGYRLESRLFGEQGMFGALDESLDFADGYFLAKAVGTFLQHRHASVYACVSSDAHPLSVPLESEVVRGLLECGVRVLSFNVSPTPLVRFAATELRAQVAFSITRGSLPETHSGVKIFLEGSALDKERAVLLRNIAANGNWCKDAGGRLAKSEGVDAYTMRLFAETTWRQENNTRGNNREGEGIVRHLLPRVLLAESAHGGSAEVLGAIAARLSAHAEQVLVLEDAAALRLALQQEREQVGFLFNSDGTALQAFVGGRGELSAEEMFGLLLRRGNISGKDARKDTQRVRREESEERVVLADGLVEEQAVRDWQSRPEFLGVRVVRCAEFGAGMLTCLKPDTGAAVQGVSHQGDAVLSSDGHITLCDSYYPFEDAFYIMLRFLSGLATGSLRLDALRALPSRKGVSGLLRILVAKSGSGGSGSGLLYNKDALLMQLRAYVKSSDDSDSDGSEGGDSMEVERRFSYGRWIVRAARFEEALLARCEGEDEKAMERVKVDLREALSSCGVASVLSEFVFS